MPRGGPRVLEERAAVSWGDRGSREPASAPEHVPRRSPSRCLHQCRRPRGNRDLKRTTQPYFVLHGNICALLAAKDHVNLFLYDGGIVPDPHGIITAGHGNKTARTVAVRDGETLNTSALAGMFKAIIANTEPVAGENSSEDAKATERLERVA
jgi:hypothetical protein